MYLVFGMLLYLTLLYSPKYVHTYYIVSIRLSVRPCIQSTLPYCTSPSFRPTS